jgi:sirohydrochlorin cobaltochelatase
MLEALERALRDCRRLGQIAIAKSAKGFVLTHCDDELRPGLETFRSPEDAIALSKFDEAGKYRPLKTAPNLRRGWRMEVVDLSELARALDYFYPGRLSIFAAWQRDRLATTPLRATLERQSGMYRIAARISDEQIDGVVGDFCRSDGGCLRTILWKRDAGGAVPSTKLPPEKYEVRPPPATIPLLCQEACNLLVNACREAVKSE